MGTLAQVVYGCRSAEHGWPIPLAGIARLGVGDDIPGGWPIPLAGTARLGVGDDRSELKEVNHDTR